MTALHAGWQQNYPSVEEHAALAQAQFEQEEREYLMSRMSLREAIERYGDTPSIAATGAIAKKGRADDVWVIFDGTHGIDLNPGVRVRDRLKVFRVLGRQGGHVGDCGGGRPALLSEH